MDKQLGLHRLTCQTNGIDEDEKDCAKLEKLHTGPRFTILAAACKGPDAVEITRKHLDSGPLKMICEKMVANYFNPKATEDWTCFGHVPVILAAGAMSLGCRTLLTAPGYKVFFSTYKTFVEGIYETAPFMDKAKQQMQQALNGGFKPGTPYDSNPRSLVEVLEAREKKNVQTSLKDEPFYGELLLGGRPGGYHSTRKHGAGECLSMIGPCTKGDMDYSEDPDVCGGCETSEYIFRLYSLTSANPYAEKSNMMQCAKCKDMKYCSRSCQIKDFSRHKVICRKPEDAMEMKVNAKKWMNSYYIGDGEGMMAGLGGLGRMMGIDDVTAVFGANTPRS